MRKCELVAGSGNSRQGGDGRLSECVCVCVVGLVVGDTENRAELRISPLV